MVNAYLRPSVGENVFFAEDVTRAEREREERLGGDTSPYRVRRISDIGATRSREIGRCG